MNIDSAKGLSSKSVNEEDPIMQEKVEKLISGGLDQALQKIGQADPLKKMILLDGKEDFVYQGLK